MMGRSQRYRLSQETCQTHLFQKSRGLDFEVRKVYIGIEPIISARPSSRYCGRPDSSQGSKAVAKLSCQVSTLLIGVAICSSVAMALPVSTPPNALADATGFIKQKYMVKTGLIMGLIGLLLGYLVLIYCGVNVIF